MDDETAISLIMHGKESGLEDIIDRYGAYVGTVVHNIIGQFLSPVDVEEVASDVFFALWQNSGRVRPGKLKPYLAAIARNAAKNKLRRLKIELSIEGDNITLPADSDLSGAGEDEVAAAARRAVFDMEEPDREIFLRYYYYMQKIPIIAEEMQINESTVKARLRRGREKLKAELSNWRTQ
ncbi:MAG: sigma-70 family RNA polymerase sigma factor [Oscillospiraceae bacterium]|nr:sigma-70 family RNA polymerase sigma factor [Oscillospiraceae bacterium]